MSPTQLAKDQHCWYMRIEGWTHQPVGLQPTPTLTLDTTVLCPQCCRFFRRVLTVEAGGGLNLAIGTLIAYGEAMNASQGKRCKIRDGRSEHVHPQTISNPSLLLYPYRIGALDLLLILLDGMHARRTAQAAGLQVWGALKVLLEAKSKGLIGKFEPFVTNLSRTGGKHVQQTH